MEIADPTVVPLMRNSRGNIPYNYVPDNARRRAVYVPMTQSHSFLQG